MYESTNATEGSNKNERSGPGGGDQSEDVECPLCGESVGNVALPRHMRSDACDGGESL